MIGLLLLSALLDITLTVHINKHGHVAHLLRQKELRGWRLLLRGVTALYMLYLFTTRSYT